MSRRAARLLHHFSGPISRVAAGVASLPSHEFEDFRSNSPHWPWQRIRFPAHPFHKRDAKARRGHTSRSERMCHVRRCAPICRTVVESLYSAFVVDVFSARVPISVPGTNASRDAEMPAGAIGAAAATRTYPQARASARDTPDRRSRRKASSPTAGFGWPFALAIPQKRRRNLTRTQPALRSQRVASSASMTGLARGSAHMGHQTKNLNIVLVLFEKQIKSVASNSINCPKFR